MKTTFRRAFENVKITKRTRSDRRSLAVRIVERMKAQDQRIASARISRTAVIERAVLDGEKGR
jgi:hypothetical protein